MRNRPSLTERTLVLTMIVVGTNLVSAGSSRRMQVPDPHQEQGQHAAKHQLGLDDFDKWPSVSSAEISDDGKYAMFTVNQGRLSTLSIRGMETNWKIEVLDGRSAKFTSDSRRAVFIVEGKGVCVATLSTSDVRCLPNSTSFRLVNNTAGEWMLYQTISPDKSLIVENMATGKRETYANVQQYIVSPDSARMALVCDKTVTPSTAKELLLVDIVDRRQISVWQGQAVGDPVFDRSGNQLAFMVIQKEGEKVHHSIWNYVLNKGVAKKIVADQDLDTNKLTVGEMSRFTSDGERIFVSLKEDPLPQPKPGAVMLDLWSYRDPKIQSKQLDEIGRPVPPFYGDQGVPQGKSFVAIVDLNSRRIIRLQNENEQIDTFDGKNDDVAFVSKMEGEFGDSYWNPTARPYFYLISTQTGERKPLPMGLADIGTSISPGAKYLILSDAAARNFFAYETATGRTVNITRRLPIPLFDPEYDDDGSPKRRGIMLAAWLRNCTGLLIYDKYDIWLLDPTGWKAPVNVTNGYGRRHKVVFRLAGGLRYRDEPVESNSTVLLTAFNKTTKDNGFYSKALGQSDNPERLSMGPYLYCVPDNNPGLPEFPPLKARNTDVYIVQRQSAPESPNFFWTKDFKSFHALSSIYPEKDYGWLTSKLIHWTTPRGRTIQGVVYKPEGFDPRKKYPVIVHYYEKKTDYLHRYEAPEGGYGGPINIPWFVSRGYVVFTPDIYYRVGEVGQSAYESLVSGAKFLQKLPWVDPKRIGLMGHSFGGFETNYTIAHTSLFAAAVSSCGPADLVSDYGSTTWRGGDNMQNFSERGQNRMGATLWERPDRYIKNSPVFRADKVTTPLLMMSNPEDSVVHFSQGLEWFLNLRRAGKKVWMLEYDGEAHGLVKSENVRDYTKRITQFFNYYLKGDPPPVWMTNGVPARLKGIDTGLELDTSGAKP